MSEMVDRAARAMLAALREQAKETGAWMDDGLFDDGSVGECRYDGAFDTVAIVRSVIAAMREPTEAQVVAHMDAEDCGDDHRAQAIADWRAMIDAALEQCSA